MAQDASAARRARQERYARRVLVGGRLVAPVRPEQHGRKNTYSYHGCRCAPCTEATSAANLRTVQTVAIGEGQHGTQYGYSKGCRCGACKAANVAPRKARFAQRYLFHPEAPHGTTNGFSNYGCRCPACRKAMADYDLALKKRRSGSPLDAPKDTT